MRLKVKPNSRATIHPSQYMVNINRKCNNKEQHKKLYK